MIVAIATAAYVTTVGLIACGFVAGVTILRKG